MTGQRGEKLSGTSSIALLQERFRQLQKMREKREEKEHHRLIYPEPEHTCTTMPALVPFEHANINSQKDSSFPSKTPQQESPPLHLGLELRNKHTNLQSFNNSTSSDLWSNNATFPASTTPISPSYNYEKWDVDTSLHL
ncbi:Chlorophyll a/b-binding family protein [Heracleum sosnowskyi]|uniref:Chlorophyll a/b-binding family protein n=1 Tax=Heracleum sosnowskyi TaxID=360622 RepID=A0AAD8GTD9_9APIA|nr:Chlorophyll a/b-binding family protein [Heracleum sosnowskyi]